jgi:divalent metal cation (Fe/Co/Zn/Cd) transporter
MDLETKLIVLNIGYAVITGVIAIALILGIKARQPKYYGLLFWAIIILIAASFFFGLYGNWLEVFTKSSATSDIEKEVKNDLISTLKILVYIVPGVMAAVASNLITEFLLRDKPAP